jgi:hypothetical protein
MNNNEEYDNIEDDIDVDVDVDVDIDNSINIDDKWLRDFKEQEQNYNDFYKIKPTSIKMYFLYVNSHNVVEFFKNDTYLLNEQQDIANNAILHKDVLLSIIKNNMQLNGNNYKLISLLKFNLDVEPEDIINMTLNKQDGTEYLSSEKEIKDILFYDTICILQDINSLFFVYQHKLTINENHSNSNSNNNNSNSNRNRNINNHNKTHKNVKKIYLNDIKSSNNSNKKYTLKNKVDFIMKKV